MEAAAHTDPEAWLQQHSLALRGKLSSKQMPQVRKLRTAKTGQMLRKVKQVQVSPKVRQVTNPSRRKEEQRHLLKMSHHPQTQNRAPAIIPLMPQQ